MIYLVIFLVAIVSFLFGFVVNILAFPFVIERLWKGFWKCLNGLNSYSIFRWSVSLIVSFAIGILVIRHQNERIQKKYEEHYMHVVDSLRWILKVEQANKSV